MERIRNGTKLKYWRIVLASNIEFYFFVQDESLLHVLHGIVNQIWEEPKSYIFDNIDDFSSDIKGHVFFVDSYIEFFQEKFSRPEQKNLIIVVNDILNDFGDYPFEVYITKNKVVTSLSAILFDLKNNNSLLSKYFCVELKHICLNEISPCDLYLRIHDEKYLKIHSTNLMFDRDVYDRYAVKSEFLWVLKDDFYEHGDFLYGKQDLERKIYVPFSPANSQHFQLVYDFAHSCGISERTIKSVEAATERIKESASKTLKTIFKKAEDLEGSFLMVHSHLCALLCVEVAKKQSWFKSNHVDKLVMASYFHDLGYKNPENTIYEGLPKSKLKDLDEVVREDVLGHIDEIIKILEKVDQIDNDIVNIIKRHHGGRGVDSYPATSYAVDIDLLSGTFLLCHSFTIGFFKMGMDVKQADRILAYISMVYNKGNLKKIFPSFCESIEELIKG